MFGHRDYLYVKTLADLGSFRRAAEACHVSQPALSMQIRKMEEVLGFALFERAGKSIHLTAEGEVILNHARRILEESEAMAAAAASLRHPLQGVVKIAAIPTMGPYLWPQLMPKLRKHLPKVDWQLYELKTQDLLHQLEAAQIDIGLCAAPAEGRGLIETRLDDEPFLLCVPAAHPLSGREQLDSIEVPVDELILLEEGHCLRDQALDVCERLPENRTGYAATSLETLRQMVAAGSGITFMPRSAAHKMPGIKYIPFRGNGPHRTRVMVTRASYPKPAIVETVGMVIAGK